MATVSANRLELLQIADAVAREKAIDRKIVLGAMEDAIAKAARSRYGSETEVRAEIDSKSGELHLSRHMLVVDTVENSATQITNLHILMRDCAIDHACDRAPLRHGRDSPDVRYAARHEALARFVRRGLHCLGVAAYR